MRVSTRQFYDQSVTTLMNQQAKLVRIQNEIAQGTRLLSPADDPAASAQIVQIDQAIESTAQFQRNADTATSRLELEETSLDEGTTTLQRVRELVIQAKTTLLTDADRSFISSEVRQRLDELAGMANSRDFNGDYLYAGFQTQGQPFTRAASGVYAYNGDQGQRLLQVSQNRQIADGDSGFAVFEGVRNGNGTFVVDPNSSNAGTGIIDPGSLIDPATYQADAFRIVFTSATTFDVINDTDAVTVLSSQTYTENATISFNGIQTKLIGQPASGDTFSLSPSANQSIFTTVNDLLTALQTPLSSPAAKAEFTHATNRSLTDIDQALGKMLEIRTSVGARLRSIDSQKQVNDDLNFQLADVRSKLHDLDITEASVRLNQELVGLQAAQQAFIRTQGLSLFALLR